MRCFIGITTTQGSKTIIFTMLAVILLSLYVGRVTSFRTTSKTPVSFDREFSANSKAGRNLIESSTFVNGSRSLEDSSYDFVGRYSIKFLDCHSVSQWNGGDGDEEDNGDGYKRIEASSLIRFRLCPTSSCQAKSSSGCSSKYGDYLVDMNTFVYNYLSAQAAINDDVDDYCYTECAYDDDNCKQDCFEANGGSGRNYYSDDSIDPSDYSQCAAFEDYYLGPYCSNDGKSIYLGLFSDDGCSEFANCGNSCFQSKYGYNLPYAEESVVSKNCLSCSYNYFSQQYDGSSDYGASDGCKEIYSNAGKCETRMSISYPNDSACKYIEGIKFLQKNGVISYNSVKRSKAASLGIGMLTFVAMLLGIYVHYLSISKYLYQLFWYLPTSQYSLTLLSLSIFLELYRAKFNLSSPRRGPYESSL